MQMLIRKRREAMQLSVQDVASRVGVTPRQYTRWERGDRTVPESHRQRLAELLEVDAADLVEGRTETHEWRLPESLTVDRRGRRRPYPVGASIDDLLRLGSYPQRVHDTARQYLTAEEYRIVLDEFPRDTSFELLLIFLLVMNGGRLVWTSPFRLGCPMLVLDDFLPDHGCDQMQWALLWERDGEYVVLFSQIRLKAPYAKSQARVDFLVFHKRPRLRGQWSYVELDGSQHATQPSQDTERAESLLVPETRYDNLKLLDTYWFPRFLEDLRAKSAEGARRERERRKTAERYRGERAERIRQRREAA